MTKKSTIARLLSEENITVTHRKANTASFNVETRELVLPIFKDEISNDLYDMFTCHEVGHALITPADGWRIHIPLAYDGLNTHSPY